MGTKVLKKLLKWFWVSDNYESSGCKWTGPRGTCIIYLFFLYATNKRTNLV